MNDQLIYEDAGKKKLEEWMYGAYDFLKPEYPKFYKMDQLSKLGFLACEVLLKNRRLSDEYEAGKNGIVLSNGSSSIDTDRKYLNSTHQIASPALFVYTLPNIVAGELSIRHELKGENGFFIFAHFDAGFISAYVENLIQRGAQSCIAGWIETQDEEYDVFLYLAEKEKKGIALPHTHETVGKIYKQ